MPSAVATVGTQSDPFARVLSGRVLKNRTLNALAVCWNSEAGAIVNGR